jgi:hypothetical protein
MSQHALAVLRKDGKITQDQAEWLGKLQTLFHRLVKDLDSDKFPQSYQAAVVPVSKSGSGSR